MTDLPRVRIGIFLCLALAGIAGCESSTPTAPVPVPVAGPSISCPAPLSAQAAAQLSIVTFSAPVVQNGTPPVVTTCTIQSGATLPVGTTTVTCTAADAASRVAQCVFDIKLTAAPKLIGTRILAFGDSITCCEVAPPRTVQVTDPAHSYPVILQALVNARYRSQAVLVFQDGSAGESVFAGEDRFVDAVNTTHPDVVLLLEGTNDVNVFKDPALIVSALRSDVRRARDRGVRLVLVSTLLPQVPANCDPGICRAANPAGVVDVNDGIRDIASGPGVALVDMYAAFLPHVSTLIGNDGLHATVDGYQTMADTFLASLVANFEEPLPPGPLPLSATSGGAAVTRPGPLRAR